MTTAYPAALDTYADPAGGSIQGSTSPTHAGHHTNHNDAVEALEAKLGTGASTASANTVLRGTGTGVTSYGQVATAMLAANAVTQVQTAGNTLTEAVSPSTTYTTYVVMDDMSVPITTTGGDVVVWFEGSFTCDTALKACYVGLSINSTTTESIERTFQFGSTGVVVPVAAQLRWTGLAAATYTIRALWKTTASATLSNTSRQRSLLVMEIKR